MVQGDIDLPCFRQGKRLWEVPLGSGERIDEIVVSKGGRWVVGITSDIKDRFKNNRIQIWQGGGITGQSSSDWGVLQNIVLFEDESTVFVQSDLYHGVFDIHTNRQIWRRLGQVRTFTGFISHDNKNIFLLLIIYKQSPPPNNLIPYYFIIFLAKNHIFNIL